MRAGIDERVGDVMERFALTSFQVVGQVVGAFVSSDFAFGALVETFRFYGSPYDKCKVPSWWNLAVP